MSSNVLRRDYAGSAACAGCHDDQVAAWSQSAMHQMTRSPSAAIVRAPFDGQPWRFKQDVAIPFVRGDQRFVQVRSARFGDHLYRVTRIIGGHHREDFAGVEIPSMTMPPTSASGVDELVLPISYVFDGSSFRLKGYSVMVKERPGLRAGGLWNQTCLFCHNTIPLFDTLWGALAGPGAPGYQGTTVDRLLPPDRRVQVSIDDQTGVRRAVADELAAIGAAGAVAEPDDDLPTVFRRAISATRRGFGGAHVIELGVGCESCHGGSLQHVRRPSLLPRYAPTSPLLSVRGADGREPTRAEWINRSCARCHQVLFSRYPHTWEGGSRRSPDAGGSHLTSGEARDFLLGACARAMSCTTCHDPHRRGDPAAMARLATAQGNPVCLTCHPSLAGASALAAHSHHDPAGAGGSCVACHMPRKNLGLGYELTRYHRIGSPNEPARVERDRPLECALCHPSHSTSTLVDAMERWWGKRYDRRALQALYGDLTRPPLLATLERGKPHEQATALGGLRETPVPGSDPLVARALVNDYPLVRHWAWAALRAGRGARCAIDLNGTTQQIARAATACVPEAGALVPPAAAEDQTPDED